MNVKNINEQNRTAAIGVSFDVPNEKDIIAILVTPVVYSLCLLLELTTQTSPNKVQ